MRVEHFQLRPQVPGLVFQPLNRHLQVLLGQVRLEKDIFFPPTFSSSSDSKKAFLSIAAFILPSKSSKLRMFQLGKIFPRSINKKRICINGKQFTTWPRCFFLPSQGHHSAAPALAHTYKNDKETFLKANEDKVKFQFLVGRTCATCP